MNNFPLDTENLFMHRSIKAETNSDRIMDMARWTARASGCAEEHLASYTTGMLAMLVSILNSEKGE